MKISELIDRTVDSEEVHSIVQDIHRDSDDFEEGDLSDRIYNFDEYKLVAFPINKLNLTEWDVDDGMVKDFMEEISKNKDSMPPIVYDPVHKSIIDGIHRANAFNNLGYTHIPAYVGSKKSSWFEANTEM